MGKKGSGFFDGFGLSDALSIGSGAAGFISDMLYGNQYLDLEKQNLNMQAATNQWMQAVQHHTWEREDNAVQRRVADLKAAGLNPILAAGQGAGTSAGMKLQAPQMGGQHIERKAMAVQNAMAVMKMKADISQTNAQKKYIDTQSAKVRQEIDHNAKMYPLKEEQERITMMYFEQMSSEKMNQMVTASQRALNQLDIQELDKQLKSHGVTQAQLNITATQLQNQLREKELSQREKEILIKDVTLQIQKQIEERYRHDNQWYMQRGYPTNIGFDKWSRIPSMLESGMNSNPYSDTTRKYMNDSSNLPIPE